MFNFKCVFSDQFEGGIITHTSRLGIDKEKVLELGTDKKSNMKGRKNETIIDIEPIKNVRPSP